MGTLTCRVSTASLPHSLLQQAALALEQNHQPCQGVHGMVCYKARCQDGKPLDAHNVLGVCMIFARPHAAPFPELAAPGRW